MFIASIANIAVIYLPDSFVLLLDLSVLGTASDWGVILGPFI